MGTACTTLSANSPATPSLRNAWKLGLRFGSAKPDRELRTLRYTAWRTAGTPMVNSVENASPISIESAWRYSSFLAALPEVSQILNPALSRPLA